MASNSEPGPGSAANASEALFRWWSSRTWANRRWIKLFALAMFGAFCLAAIGVWHLTVLLAADRWVYADAAQSVAVFMSLFFVVVRVQLAAVPALVAVPEFMPQFWVLLRSTPVSGRDVTFAMFRHAWVWCVLPFTILMIPESVLYAAMTPYGGMEIPLPQLVVLTAILVALGFVLAGLAYLGGLIWRNMFGVLVGAISPLILGALIGVGSMAWTFFGFSIYGDRPLFKLFVLLATPEYYFMMALDRGPIMFGSVDSPLSLLAKLVVGAFVLWKGLELIVSWRLRRA